MSFYYLFASSAVSLPSRDVKKEAARLRELTAPPADTRARGKDRLYSDADRVQTGEQEPPVSTDTYEEKEGFLIVSVVFDSFFMCVWPTDLRL